MISQRMKWDDRKSYRVSGIISQLQSVAVFDLKDFHAIEKASGLKEEK